MTACAGDLFNQEFPYLLCKGRIIGCIYIFNVIYIFDIVKQHFINLLFFCPFLFLSGNQGVYKFLKKSVPFFKRAKNVKGFP